VEKLKDQLTNRYYKGFDTTQGKLALESKAEARANGHKSPDRADGYVLCMFSYRPNRTESKPEPPKGSYVPRPVSREELGMLMENGLISRKDSNYSVPGRFTYQGLKI
jgi:hypothetical protein